MASRLPRGRSWLAAAAGILILLCLLPPVGTYARRYVFAESLQFVLFATAVPALLVLGAPWRLLGFTRAAGPAVAGGFPGLRRVGGHAARLAPAARPARAPRPERRGSGFLASAAVLLVFMGTVIAWRLPASVNALAAVPGLAVLEMATLAAAGSALWLELVESPPLLPRLSRPLRATFATLAMWTIWVLAYILGFSQVAWFRAYAHAGGLNAVSDQEIATGVMWAVPAFCFVPVVYVALLTWLKDTEDPDEGLRALVGGEHPQQRPGRWPRPPRGWDTHSA
jgi:cytochrome c oxidase assembly factor CtaG